MCGDYFSVAGDWRAGGKTLAHVFCHNVFDVWNGSEVTHKCIVQVFADWIGGWWFAVTFTFEGLDAYISFDYLLINRVLGIELLQKLYIEFYGCYTHIYI